MVGEETIAALIAIWDEGPSSECWDVLLPELIQLMDQFQQSADDKGRTNTAMQITDILRP